MAIEGSDFVRLEHVSKRYGNVVALDDVSFRIRQGEIFGYIGPNGAGKTTTIRIMVGLLRSFDGRVSVGSHSIGENSRAVQELLGYLPQHAAFQEWRTVDRALTTFGRLSGLDGGDLERRKKEALDRCGLTEVRFRKVGQLSGGTLQKLGLAQALLHGPRLLVLDEPMAGLDPASRFEFKTIFRRLRDEGATIFFSSHILSDVQDIANRIGILNRGQTMHVGTLDELKASLGIGRSVEVVLSHDSGRRPDLTARPFVREVEALASNHFVVHIDPASNVDEAVDTILRDLLAADCRVRSISPVSPNLEELYVRFISGGSAR